MTENYEQRRVRELNEERTQATQTRKLATLVAGLLGGGYTVETGTVDDWTGIARYTSIRNGEARLSFSRMWNKPDRIEISGCPPHDARNVVGKLGRHEITVAASRDASAVTREIERRLLPGYLADLDRVTQAIARRDAELAARPKIADDLKAAVPALRDHLMTSGRTGLGTYGENMSGDIEIYGDGAEVMINLRGPTDVLLPLFIAALGGAA